MESSTNIRSEANSPRSEASSPRSEASSPSNNEQDKDMQQQTRGPDTADRQGEEELTSFAEGSTLHGLSHVCLTSSSKLRRAFWLLLMLAMLTCYLYLAIISIGRYYSYESTTKVSRHLVDKLDFPAVSICPVNSIPESFVANDTESRNWI